VTLGGAVTLGPLTLTLGPLTLRRAMTLTLGPLTLRRAVTLTLGPLTLPLPLPSRRPAIPVAVAITVAPRGRWARPDASVGVGRARVALGVGIVGNVRFAADPIGLELVVPASHSVKPSGKGPLRGRGFLD
jgi:hypothetical protein